MKYSFKTLLVLIALCTLFSITTSCGDDNDDGDDTIPPTSQATNLIIVDGNLQAGFLHESLEFPLVVKAAGVDGVPVSGLEVKFEILTGAGEGKADDAVLAIEEQLTNTNGLASCTVTLGEKAGMLRVRAGAVDGSVRPVTFTLSAYHAPTETKKPICFLSINDFHAHPEAWGHPEDLQGGLARIVYLMKKVRENNTRVGVETVILDAGDDFENTLFSDVPGFLSWLIATWDRAGVDVWQVGNHDYHFGIPFLTDKVKSASTQFTPGPKGHNMEVTFGNVNPSTIREDLTSYIDYFETDFSDYAQEKLYQQTSIIQAGPVRVGILGVVTDVAVYTQVPGDPFFYRVLGSANPYAEKITFLNPDPRKSDYIADGIDNLIAQGAHAVVVVSHTGLGLEDRVNLPPGKDEFIACFGQGKTTGRPVDLIIGAHSHVQLNHPISLENPAGTFTPIVQAREGGLFAARTDAMVDIASGGLEMLDSRLIQINSDLEKDPAILTEMETWREKAIAQYGDWFGWELIDSDVWLSHRAETISGLGQLINDSFHWSLAQNGTPVDSSMSVPSLYRSDIWPGTFTAKEAYDVLPLHKMDEVGHAPDTISVINFRPGLFNTSFLFLPGTWQETTGVAFALEVLHALPELQEGISLIGDQLNIEVAQMSGVSYEVDLTAPIFHKVVPGSLTMNGEPIDPDRPYSLAMVHSLATTLAYALNTLVTAIAPGEGLVDILVPDPVTGEPFHDTGVPIWQAFQEYLDQMESPILPREDLLITGQNIRPVQPELTVNPIELAAAGTRRGETATFTVRVRNNGMTAVESAQVRMLVDVTPYDQTDQDDGRSLEEGLGEAYLGSLTEVGSKYISLDAHPDYVDLEFPWEVPADQPVGLTTMHVRIRDIIGEGTDPNTGEPFADPWPDNNSGEQVMAYFHVE